MSDIKSEENKFVDIVMIYTFDGKIAAAHLVDKHITAHHLDALGVVLSLDNKIPFEMIRCCTFKKDVPEPKSNKERFKMMREAEKTFKKMFKLRHKRFKQKL